MKPQVNRFPNELKLKIVQEYLSTDISQVELREKYHFGGAGSITRWMRKFGLTTSNQEPLKANPVMTKEAEKPAKERELEARIKQLEKDLDYEKLRVQALDTLIDIAEKDLKIPIRKKPGAKQ